MDSNVITVVFNILEKLMYFVEIAESWWYYKLKCIPLLHK